MRACIQVFPQSLVFDVPVSSIPSEVPQEPATRLWAAIKGTGRKQRIPKRREVDRAFGRRPLREEHRAGSSQRTPTNLFYLLCLGPAYMSTGRLYGLWCPMIMVFGALFFEECLGASRSEPRLFLTTWRSFFIRRALVSRDEFARTQKRRNFRHGRYVWNNYMFLFLEKKYIKFEYNLYHY